MNLTCDKLHSNFAIKCNLRHYIMAAMEEQCVDWGYEVGRCWFTPGWKQSTPRLLSALETNT